MTMLATTTRATPARARRAGGRRLREITTALAPPLGLGVILLVGWTLLVTSGIVSSTIPSPRAVADYVLRSARDLTFWGAIGSTALRWLMGFVASWALGTLLGLAAALNKTTDLLLSSVVEFFRPIPPIVYLPFVLLAMGTRNSAVTILVVSGAMWPVLLQTRAGVHDVDRVLLDVGAAYNLTFWQRLRSVVAPSALPFQIAGIRMSMTIALIVVVMTEMLGTGSGIGGAMATAEQSGSYAALFGLALVAAVLGLVADGILSVLERRMIPWGNMVRQENAS